MNRATARSSESTQSKTLPAPNSDDSLNQRFSSATISSSHISSAMETGTTALPVTTNQPSDGQNNEKVEIWYRLMSNDGNYLDEDCLSIQISLSDKVFHLVKQVLDMRYADIAMRYYHRVKAYAPKCWDLQEQAQLRDNPNLEEYKNKALVNWITNTRNLNELQMGRSGEYFIIIKGDLPLLPSFQSFDTNVNVEAPRYNVILLLDETKQVNVPHRDLETMDSLLQFVSQQSENYDTNLVLYERLFYNERKLFVRLLAPPRRSMTLILRESRVSPRGSLESLRETSLNVLVPDEPLLKNSFKNLYDLIHNSIDVSTFGILSRVAYVPASHVLGSAAKQDAPDIPIVIRHADNEKYSVYPNFLYFQKGVVTEEMKEVQKLVDKNSSAMINLGGVSGCGKTTTVFGLGTRQRMIYASGEFYCYSAMNDCYRENRTKDNFIQVFRSWIVTRLLLIVYLEQEYGFDFLDLMSCQDCRRFETLHESLMHLYWMKSRPKEIGNHLKLLMESYNPLICIDECHSILNQSSWSGQIDVTGKLVVTYSTIWDALFNGMTSKLSLILLTTYLSDFVQLRLHSVNAKFNGTSQERFEQFRKFTFHESPKFLKIYVDIPDDIAQWLKGRARFGTHFLQCMIENISQFTPDSNNWLYQIFYRFYKFHVLGTETYGDGPLSSLLLSLHGNIKKHEIILGNSKKLHESLTLLMFSTLTGSTRQIGDEECVQFIQSGIGFLEPLQNASGKFTATMREPLMLQIVTNMMTNGDSICDHFIANLEKTRLYLGSTETSKGIAFQYAVTTALMTEEIKSKTLKQLLSEWTGLPIETFLKVSQGEWLRPLLDRKLEIHCVRQIRKNASFHGPFKLNTLYVLPDDARCEFVIFIEDDDGNIVAVTSGVKILSEFSNTLFEKNVTAATFDRTYMSHTGLVYHKVVTQRNVVTNLIPKIVGNIALVVTMPTIPKKEPRVSFNYDEEKQFPTVYVQFDKQNLATLLGLSRTEIVMKYYS